MPKAAVNQQSAMADNAIGMRATQSCVPENRIAYRHGPVNQGSLFQIHDAIQPRRHPVARSQHVASNLGLHGVNVIHEGWRRNDASQVDGSRDQQNS